MKQVFRYGNVNFTLSRIVKGNSDNEKYLAYGKNGERYLLRSVSSKGLSFNDLCCVLLQMENVNIRANRLVDTVKLGDAEYALYTWIEGEDLETYLLECSQEEQYIWGRRAGEVLKKIHSLPVHCVRHDISFVDELERNLDLYQKSGVKFEGYQTVVNLIKANKQVPLSRSRTLLHGDYHAGNLIAMRSGELGLIDFDRVCVGDPWKDFRSIFWSWEVSPSFVQGQLDSYFDSRIPHDFFAVVRLYIFSFLLRLACSPDARREDGIMQSLLARWALRLRDDKAFLT